MAGAQVLEFFETSGRNLLAAEAAAGVRHRVALAVLDTNETELTSRFGNCAPATCPPAAHAIRGAPSADRIR
jgi:hypothetical protein